MQKHPVILCFALFLGCLHTAMQGEVQKEENKPFELYVTFL